MADYQTTPQPDTASLPQLPSFVSRLWLSWGGSFFCLAFSWVLFPDLSRTGVVSYLASGALKGLFCERGFSAIVRALCIQLVGLRACGVVLVLGSPILMILSWFLGFFFCAQRYHAVLVLTGVRCDVTRTRTRVKNMMPRRTSAPPRRKAPIFPAPRARPYLEIDPAGLY